MEKMIGKAPMCCTVLPAWVAGTDWENAQSPEPLGKGQIKPQAKSPEMASGMHEGTNQQPFFPKIICKHKKQV